MLVRNLVVGTAEMQEQGRREQENSRGDAWDAARESCFGLPRRTTVSHVSSGSSMQGTRWCMIREQTLAASGSLIMFACLGNVKFPSTTYSNVGFSHWTSMAEPSTAQSTLEMPLFTSFTSRVTARVSTLVLVKSAFGAVLEVRGLAVTSSSQNCSIAGRPMLVGNLVSSAPSYETMAAG